MGDVSLSERQNTVESLGELPDLDFLTVPVDDYFGSYVAELGARGQQDMDLQQPMAPSPFSAVPANSATDPSLSYEVPSLPDFGDQNMTFGDLDLAALPPALQPPSMPELSHGWQQQQTHLPASDSGSPDMDDDDTPHAPRSGKRSTDGINKGAKRNAKQQVQNKQAQQRYRERRKQRFTEMEHVIDDLTTQLQSLQGLQTQNDELKVKATALERMVTDKQVETEQLQRRLAQLASVEEELRSRDSVSATQALSTAEMQQYANAYADDITQINKFMALHQLYEADVTGRGVNPAIMKSLGELVSQGFVRCARALRAHGVQALDLMTRNLDEVSHCSCPVRREKWSIILDALKLTNEQQEQLMLIRKNHLVQLRAVLQERQNLNMQAISEMLPRPGEQDPAEPTALDGKMACIGNAHGYLPCAKRSVQLNTVLDAVKENLHQEQKRVMEIKFVVVHRVLTPIQAAIMTTKAHPAHVDVLALVNMLASRLGRSDSTSNNSSAAQTCGSSDGVHSLASTHSHDDSKTDSGTCPLLAK